MNSMKLYEIADSINALMEAEEVTDEQLSEVFALLQDKASAICAVSKNFDATLDALDTEIKRLTAMKKAVSNRQEQLKQYTIYQMQKMDVTELKSGVHSLKLKKCPPVVNIFDENAIPARFKTVVTTVNIDKNAIKKELADDYIVDGAELTTGVRLEIK